MKRREPVAGALHHSLGAYPAAASRDSALDGASSECDDASEERLVPTTKKTPKAVPAPTASSSSVGCPGPSPLPGVPCGGKLFARGLCQVHYRQDKKKEPLRPVQRHKAAVPGSVRRYGITWSNIRFPEWVKAEAARQDRSPLDIIGELVEASITASDTRRR